GAAGAVHEIDRPRGAVAGVDRRQTEQGALPERERATFRNVSGSAIVMLNDPMSWCVASSVPAGDARSSIGPRRRGHWGYATGAAAASIAAMFCPATSSVFW